MTVTKAQIAVATINYINACDALDRFVHNTKGVLPGKIKTDGTPLARKKKEAFDKVRSLVHGFNESKKKKYCELCGGVGRIQREPCSCESVMVRESGLISTWICDPCDTDLDDDQTISCPECNAKESVNLDKPMTGDLECQRCGGRRYVGNGSAFDPIRTCPQCDPDGGMTQEKWDDVNRRIKKERDE